MKPTAIDVAMPATDRRSDNVNSCRTKYNLTALQNCGECDHYTRHGTPSEDLDPPRKKQLNSNPNDTLKKGVSISPDRVS